MTRRKYCIIVSVEGLNESEYFTTAPDRDDFVKRLSAVLSNTERLFKSDERILGDSDFVEMLCGETEKMERRWPV